MILMTIYGLVTLLLMIAFVCLCIWSYSPSRYDQFRHDANIPFINDDASLCVRGDHTHV